MEPNEIDVNKVQQIFHRFSNDKTDDFDVYRKYVLSFCLNYLRNTTLNVTLKQLQSLLKEEPQIECGLFYKHCKFYRLLVIVSNAQTVLGIFCDTEDCLDTRNRFKRFWSALIHPLWSILSLKL